MSIFCFVVLSPEGRERKTAAGAAVRFRFLCGQNFSFMQWSMSFVIYVVMLKNPAVGAMCCSQMHVCGFHASMVTMWVAFGFVCACSYRHAHMYESVHM